MNRVRSMTGGQEAAAAGYTGEGIYAAVLDSGVAKHPDLQDQIVAFRDFSKTKGKAAQGSCYDDNGHGTHV